MGGSGGGLEQHCVSKHFAKMPLRIIKSLRAGLSRPCFPEVAPTQLGLQNKTALGTAQFGSKVMAERHTERPRSND